MKKINLLVVALVLTFSTGCSLNPFASAPEHKSISGKWISSTPGSPVVEFVNEEGKRKVTMTTTIPGCECCESAGTFKWIDLNKIEVVLGSKTDPKKVEVVINSKEDEITFMTEDGPVRYTRAK